MEVSLRRAEADRERIWMGVHSMLTVCLQGWGLLAETLVTLPLQINELSNVPVPVMLMPDDFKAYSKIKVDNHLFNK